MNKMNLMIAATALSLMAGCASSSKKEAKNQPPTPAQQAATQLNTDRADYLTRTQARLDEYSKVSAQLRDKASAAQKPKKKKLENAADDMDMNIKDVQTSLNEVKESAPENWLDYKRDVTKSIQRADTQYENSVRLLQ